VKLLFVTHHRAAKADWRAGSIARELASRGHSVTLVCTAETQRWRISERMAAGVRVVEAPDLLVGRLRSGWDLWSVLRRSQFLTGREFDLVHVFETRPATIHPVLRLLKRHSAALVIDWADWWGRGGLISEQRPWWYRVLLGRVETWYEEHFRNLADATTVISRGLAGRAERLGVEKGSIFWVPNGCDPTLASQPAIDMGWCRRHFGLPADGFFVGFSASDVFMGVESLLGAFERLSSRHADVRLLMTGSLDRRLSQLIARHGARSRIHHLGFVPQQDYAFALGCADVFVVPFPDRIANHGRWPGRINDYLALGKPVITNPVGEMRSLLETHEVGLLSGEAPDALADAVEKLLLDPERRARMGTAARALAREELSLRSMVDRVERAHAFARAAHST
jgi:glycosyltransferase involved in cell wall biosynthesis